MNIRLNIDSVCYKLKPSEYAGAIRNRMARSGIVEVTPEQLMTAIEQGRSFYPGALTSTSGKSWTSQQIIAADIDNKIGVVDEKGDPVLDKTRHQVTRRIDEPLTPGKALAIMGSFGITPYFMYHSFSSTENWPRYRICIVLDEALTDPNEVPRLTNRLIAQFNDVAPHSADTVTSDNARLFFGGRPGCVFYKSGSVTALEQLRALPETEDEAPQVPEKPQPMPRADALGDPDAAVCAGATAHLDALRAQLDKDKKNFDLARYIQTTEPIRKVKRAGQELVLDPCPICGSPDGLKVKGGQWHCHSDRHDGQINRGKVIEWLMARNKWTTSQALDHFKFEIMHYDRKEWTRAWIESRRGNVEQDFSTAELIFCPADRDYSDSGNAELFASMFRDQLRYCDALGWLAWNGQYWEQDNHEAARRALDFSAGMLDEAKRYFAAADDDNARAKAYYKHAERTRSARSQQNMLSLARARLAIKGKELDADPELLNTSAGIVNLRTGEIMPHAPEKFCTKLAPVAPSPEGAEIWDDFLNLVTSNDADLKAYLRRVTGMSIIGKVYDATLQITLGNGHNGKSTFYGALSQVLGDYAGGIDVKVLTVRKNERPYDYALLAGKRLVVCKELEPGQRLSTNALKTLADNTRANKILIERKYKDSEEVEPTHHIIMHTNVLPIVGDAADGATWRRLTVIPFKAKMPTGRKDVKNYDEVLVKKAGGAILQWMIDGAREYIENGHSLLNDAGLLPAAVLDATNKYRDDEDWLKPFIDACCVFGEGQAQAGEIYSEYQAFASYQGDRYIRKGREFYDAINQLFVERGLRCTKPQGKTTWHGVHVRHAYTVVSIAQDFSNTSET